MFQKYQRTQIAELRPYVPGEDTANISISIPDLENGSPKKGDMIARNPKNHEDQWLVAEQYFKDNFVPVDAAEDALAEARKALEQAEQQLDYGQVDAAHRIIIRAVAALGRRA